MPGEFLIDTSIAIAYLAGEAPVVERIVEADKIHIPAVVLGELFFGAHKSARIAENLAKVRRILEWAHVPPFDVDTADHYGQVKAGLQAKGRPIPDNDLWIAAIALQHGRILATRDKHFLDVEGLQVENW